MTSTTLPALLVSDPAPLDLQDADIVWVAQGGVDVGMTGAQIRAGVLAGRPHDVHGQMAGVPAASEKWVYPFNRAASFAATLPSSHAGAQVAATAATTFTLYKGATSVGTIDFAIGATTATFTFTTTTAFAPGDLLTVQAPATPDATLAGLYFNLACTLT